MTERDPVVARRARRRREPMTVHRFGALLVVLLVVLAVPAAALVWLGFRELDVDALRRQQLVADGFVALADARLAAAIEREQDRPAAEYSFVVGAPGGAGPAAIIERSPLAAVPVASDLPGVIGYFEVDGEGTLSTPLLPADADPGDYGLAPDDVAARRALASKLLTILADNRLVDRRSRAAVADDAATLADRDTERRQIGAPPAPDRVAASGSSRGAGGGQAGFDRLATKAIPEPAVTGRAEREAAPRPDLSSAAPAAVSEASPAAAAGEPAAAAASTEVFAGPRRVSAFDVALEPLVFSRLDTGELVLFRNAWRGRERFVQGLVLDPARFIAGAFTDPFSAAGFAPGIVLGITVDGDAVAALPAAARPVLSARLSPPLAGIELDIGAVVLPPSPIRSVVLWSAAALVAALVGGGLAIYRFGAGQLRLARQQRTFVSGVTHELRTPLTSIRMYGEMLRAGWASESRKREYYEYISAEADRLSRLVDNVLALARIDRGVDPVLEPVTIGELLDTARSKVAAAVAAAGFTLATECEPGLESACVRVDGDAIAQIFINLVDNALKFAAGAERREIVLSAHRGSDGRIVIGVRDFGPGIAEQHLKRLFELFYRPDDELTRAVAGTGIGLALVRRLAGQMDAKVDVRNARPGAVVSISLAAADGAA